MSSNVSPGAADSGQAIVPIDQSRDSTSLPGFKPGTLIELRSATRLYGTVIGVNDLTVTLPCGAYGLVGPNGAGKSTLINLLIGALRPTLGSVRVFGQDPWRRRNVLADIGLCPSSDLLLPSTTAREWLEEMLAMSGWQRQAAKFRVREVLELVGLSADDRRPVGNYSLGMRQRTKLAQALLHDPQFLILDEPFNGLDPIGRHEMVELLKRWAASGRSLLLASHVLHEVEAVTDAFLLIYGGRLLATGTAGELRRLLASLPQELVIEGPDVRPIAGRLAGESWVSMLRLNDEEQRLELAVSEPEKVFTHLAGWIAQDGLRIRGLSGAEGDLASLFRLLVSRHLGQSDG
jgi:ABC-2 type transport system ATP-binding protein